MTIQCKSYPHDWNNYERIYLPQMRKDRFLQSINPNPLPFTQVYNLLWSSSTCYSPHKYNTGELAYDVPLYAILLVITDDMLGSSPMHMKYVSYVCDRLCI